MLLRFRPMRTCLNCIIFGKTEANEKQDFLQRCRPCCCGQLVRRDSPVGQCSRFFGTAQSANGKLLEKKRVFAVFYIIPKRVLIAILIVLTVLAVPLSFKAIREPLFRFFSQTFGGERTEIFASEEERQRALNAKIESDYQPFLFLSAIRLFPKTIPTLTIFMSFRTA